MVIFATLYLIGDPLGLLMQGPFGHIFQVINLDLNVDGFTGREGEFDIDDALLVLPPSAAEVGVCDEHTGVLFRGYAQNGCE